MGDVRDTNAPGNCWRTARQWPPVPTRATRYYLQADRSLGATPPGSTAGLSFVADPGKPVPTVGGPQLTLPAGPMDQQTVESRPDVLVFTTAALEAPVEITGRVRLRLWVTSTCADTDFFGKFCDVYPDGHSYNICEGQLRARFRRGFDRENLLQAGNTYPLDLDLGSTSIVFNRGHCLRAQVTSSSAPGYDVNPNTGAPFRADTRTLTATNTLFVDARRPSHLLLPVATAAATR
jgi:putative CocE/NonD family hydrolase